MELIALEWNSNRNYGTRVSNSRTGQGDALSGTASRLSGMGSSKSVFDDLVQDKLNGASGYDWFFADLGSNHQEQDRVTGLKGEEFLDSVEG